MGVQAKQYMDAGEYVPDEVTNDMVRARLREPDARDGFLLDGYPRTLAQVDFLDGVLAERGQALERVLELTVDTEEVVARLLRRALDQGRTDDTEDVVRRRLEVYTEQTAPLLAVYRDRGLLVQVDGLGPIDQVTDRALEALGG